MDNKTTLGVIISVVCIIFLIGSIFFERTEINTSNWQDSYDFESQEPYGAWLFRKMVDERFGNENVYENNRDINIAEIDTSGFLYIYLASYGFKDEKEKAIKYLAELGNEVLLIVDENLTNLTDVHHSSNDLFTDSDSLFRLEFPDTTLVYKNYRGSIEKASLFDPMTIDLTGRIEISILGISSDTSAFFYRKTLDEGYIHHHTAPFLFSNIGAKQEYYLKHWEWVMSKFKSKKVILDSPFFTDFNPYNKANNSPIQYILSQKSLAWAYYAFLFTTIVFVFFRGKRKQRAIPVLVKNENTSIQYIDTLSELFKQQNQNEKLVPHMQAIFYHKIKQKYYLAHDHKEFVEVLSRKSKIPEKNIRAIVNNLKSGSSGYHFSDDQLIMLYRRIEEFFKSAE